MHSPSTNKNKWDNLDSVLILLVFYIGYLDNSAVDAYLIISCTSDFGNASGAAMSL